MDKEQVGVVGELYRYPVKSMLGERLAELEVGPKGVVGDRAWALRETNGRIASAKKWANLFEFAAGYESPPEAERLAPLRITMPDGRAIRADAADASAVISAVLGRSVRLERARSDEHARGEIDPNTVFGEVGVERVMPQFTAATMPDSFAFPRGSFFDSAAIHIVASGTITYLRSLIGGDVQVDARRFRPNIVIDSGTQQNAFVEDGWLDGVLQVGDQVRIVSMESALRCVMTTHPQTDLRRDPRILRAAAQYHHARLGVFASVGAAGTVRVGDPVWLTK